MRPPRGKNMGKIAVIKKLRKWSPPEIEDVQEPFCGSRRRNLIPISQSHPEVADEWLYKKNCGWTPDDFSKGSSVKAYWECSNCFGQYKAVINNRTNGSACPYCASKIVSNNTSLLLNFPEVAAEWHPTKNKKLRVENILSGSAEKVWWLCKKCNHSWQAIVQTRADRHYGCPACNNARREYARLHPAPRERKLLILGENTESLGKWYERTDKQNFVSLYQFSKAIAKQWHPAKNGKVSTKEIAKSSQAMAWWKCSNGADHEWQTTIASRTQFTTAKCPFCSNLKLSSTNTLSFKAPAVAKEWHPLKNGKLKPDQVIAGGKKKYWFQCNKDKSHEWEAQLHARIVGSKCPFCSHNRVSKDNCLIEALPEIAAQLHPTKNGKIDSSKIAVKSAKKLWWQCPEGPDHIWLAAPATRSSGRGCPFCSGKQRSISNCLATLQPETAAQWHPTKNKSMTPFTVSPFSKEIAWWLCSKGHKWKQPIAQRVVSTVICWKCFRDSRSR